MQQLLLARDGVSDSELLVSYDKLPKYTTIEQFVDATAARTSGVFELAFAGRPDNEMHLRHWGVVERTSRGAWLPSLLGQHPVEVAADSVPRRLPSYDVTTALPNALALGLSAGRILGDAADLGLVLARVRPETMWAERGEDGRLRVTGLSQRSELMFAASYTDVVGWPVFDRYYYAPEVDRNGPTDHRALVFCLAIMIAEWATGCFPFNSKHHYNGPLKGEHVALEVPDRLARLLSSGMRLDPERRPALPVFLDELEHWT